MWSGRRDSRNRTFQIPCAKRTRRLEGQQETHTGGNRAGITIRRRRRDPAIPGATVPVAKATHLVGGASCDRGDLLVDIELFTKDLTDLTQFVPASRRPPTTSTTTRSSITARVTGPAPDALGWASCTLSVAAARLMDDCYPGTRAAEVGRAGPGRCRHRPEGLQDDRDPATDQADVLFPFSTSTSCLLPLPRHRPPRYRRADPRSLPAGETMVALHGHYRAGQAGGPELRPGPGAEGPIPRVHEVRCFVLPPPASGGAFPISRTPPGGLPTRR